ncbi:LOW QUALITY PROTEIN: hypothetical protein V2J09_013822 [Rumex salicifolius]
MTEYVEVQTKTNRSGFGTLLTVVPDICNSLGLVNSFRVDAQGQSGGIWLLWKSEVGNVTIEHSISQFVHAKIENYGEVVNLIMVYAARAPHRRRTLWGELHEIASLMVEPMFIGGYFNTIVCFDERMGVMAGYLRTPLNSGHRYTWKRGETSNTYITKRLDRVLCSRIRWQEVKVAHLSYFSSNHTPLLLRLSPCRRGDPARRPFRFEAAWLSHPEFKELLNVSWDTSLSTPGALDLLRRNLKKWNKDVFSCIQTRKENLLSEIQGFQTLIASSASDQLLQQEENLVKELDIVLEQEEVFSLQKSREKWITWGYKYLVFSYVDHNLPAME